MPLQRSIAGFVFAAIAVMVLGSGVGACCSAGGCCSEHQGSVFDPTFSPIPDPGGARTSVPCERAYSLAPECCSCSNQDTTVSEGYKSRLPGQLTLSQRFDGAPTAMRLSLHPSQPEGPRTRNLAGDTLIMFKCSPLF